MSEFKSNGHVHDNLDKLCQSSRESNFIDTKKYGKYDVKRGLRNQDGTGVLAGVTRIGNVLGYYVQDGERHPMPGKLIYRGIDVDDIIAGFISEGSYGYEEVIYLLLFGSLPNTEELKVLQQVLEDYSILPDRFTEDMILSAPSRDVMNKLARSVLALYSYDDDPDNNEYINQMDKALRLIARCPIIVAHAYTAQEHYFNNKSLYLHIPKKGLSIAENFLRAVRHDKKYTVEEARLLDLCLVLHAEHGGGNNSAFACRVLSSSGTDIYSAISAAVGSLKGPRHGGANMKVMEQFHTIEANVKDWKDEDEVTACLKRLVNREIGDGSGLIYGLGHAVYSVSDPRAIILKKVARPIAEEKGMLDELELFELVERIGPDILNAARGENRAYCANVDMYSGFVYKMLDIPEQLYTPLFAVSRMTGWCAHRIEEVCNSNKIMRPAYKAVETARPFVPISQR